jgi:hypothetical protein
MSLSPHTSPRKRKKSPSPTRKKARIEGEGSTRAELPTPTITTHPMITHPPTITTHPPATSTLSRDDQAELDRFLSEINSMTHTTPPPLSTPTPIPTPTVTPTVTVRTGPKPVNPFAGTIDFLRDNFGTDYHDSAHFRATDLKSKHGVWGAKLPKVKTWVGEAINHIYDDDASIVTSKPGTGASKGGRNYLVDMGKPVGYLSGSSVPRGIQPEARYIALYVNKKGITVSAFPCTPEMF